MKPELTSKELIDLATNEKYVLQYKTVYKARLSVNAGARLEKIYYSRDKLPLTKRGRFHAVTLDEVNNLLGFELLIH